MTLAIYCALGKFGSIIKQDRRMMLVFGRRDTVNKNPYRSIHYLTMPTFDGNVALVYHYCCEQGGIGSRFQIVRMRDVNSGFITMCSQSVRQTFLPTNHS